MGTIIPILHIDPEAIKLGSRVLKTDFSSHGVGEGRSWDLLWTLIVRGATYEMIISKFSV